VTLPSLAACFNVQEWTDWDLSEVIPKEINGIYGTVLKSILSFTDILTEESLLVHLF